MPHGQFFDEFRTDLTFHGTVPAAPNRFIDEQLERFDSPDDIDITFVDSCEGFTYRINVTDVISAEQNDNGTFAVEYQKPGCDDHVTTTVTIPRGFSITSVTT